MRVAVICDFLEEHWTSMDLVGEMVRRSLAEHCGQDVAVTQLRPRLRRRFSRLPLMGDRFCNADRFVNRFVDYSSWVQRHVNDFDLFHIIDHSYAHLIHVLPPNRTVVTCHDLDTFRCVLEPSRDHRPAWFRLMTRRILAGFRKSAHVLAVSAATREELLKHKLFAPELITVVPNGVHPSCSTEADTAADAAAARLLGPDNGTLWLLNVGSTQPRKRIDVLLRVFASVLQEFPHARLVRAGGGLTEEHFQLAKALNIQEAIVNLPHLERATLAAVYRRAALLLHTADAEGFGLPVIEAMACGCPVVASDIPVLREVGGASATYCPVGDVPAWKSSVVALLQSGMHQTNEWVRSRERASAHAARFSWAENGRQTARIYRQVLAANAQ